jgi:hypothetical protein
VTDVEATDRAVATVAEKFGKLDIMLANAGIGGPTRGPDIPSHKVALLCCYNDIVLTCLVVFAFLTGPSPPHPNSGKKSGNLNKR